jgi:hypothetical protein
LIKRLRKNVVISTPRIPPERWFNIPRGVASTTLSTTQPANEMTPAIKEKPMI